MSSISEPYLVLGLEKGCTELDIIEAYKRLALLHHPDKNRGSPDSEQKFKEVCLSKFQLNIPEANRTRSKKPSRR